MKKEATFVPDDAINHFDLIGGAYEKLRFFQKNKKSIHALDSSVFEKGRRYANNPAFLAEVKRLREKWGIPEDGFSDENLLPWVQKHPMSSDDNLYRQYLEDLDNLYLAINENLLWKDFCEYFLIFNEISPYAFPQKITYGLKNRGDLVEPEIIIRVKGPVTKVSDFDEAIKWSIRMSREIYGEGRIRTATNHDRDINIYNLYKKGESIENILDELNKGLPDDKSFGHDYVYKIVKRVESKMFKNTDI